jgi:hypothetical protein
MSDALLPSYSVSAGPPGRCAAEVETEFLLIVRAVAAERKKAASFSALLASQPIEPLSGASSGPLAFSLCAIGP